MKVAIIGAGVMGSAIARGIAQGTIVPASDITVTNPHRPALDALKADFPEIGLTDDNPEAVANADIIILAVKPWMVDQVLSFMQLESDQVLVSIAAGISFDDLTESVGPELTLFRVVPNTALTKGESMTLIASRNASKEQEQLIVDIFSEMGTAMMIPESLIPATTALTSCGIAYVLKFMQAAMQAGIEMGIKPHDAQQMVAQTVKGAAALLLDGDSHPALEIEKVCTPGGITIKGLNELEHSGFTSAIIKAMKAAKGL